MKQEIRILIADDHPIMRQGLKQIIEIEPNLKVVGEAANGSEALAMIEELMPDAAILDVDMPHQDGFQVARSLIANKNPAAIIFLTMHSDEAMFHAALDLGAKGYVLKDSATTDIVAGIKSIASGKPFISPALSALLLNRRRRVNKLARQNPELDSLTPTERRILKLIAEDKTSKEIGEELFISHRTVHAHRANISNKLNLSGNLALVKFAITHKSVL